MQGKVAGADEVVVRLDDDELLILHNALSQVCKGIDLEEFHTRLGVEKEEAETLMDEIGRLIKAMRERAEM